MANYLHVPGIAPERPPYGLLSVVDMRTSTDRWENGVTYPALNNSLPSPQYDENCDPAAVTPYEREYRSLSWAEAKAQTIDVGYRCSAIGLSYEELVAAASAHLAAQEQLQLEKELWDHVIVPSSSIVPSVGLLEDLGTAEYYANAKLGTGTGVIHIPRNLITRFEGSIIRSGNQLQTLAGTPVVAGAGYVNIDMPMNAIAVTSKLIGYAGDIEVVTDTASDNADLTKNEFKAYAQRTYVIGTDGTPPVFIS